MPLNAGPEYFRAEEKFRNAKTAEEKILALEEMIRLLPKHKGTEHVFGQLRGKLSKLKKEQERRSRKNFRSAGIKKEGDAQVCIIGRPNTGKSWLLAQLTKAKPETSPYEYTTIEPQVGMIDYSGIKVQLVEIPATMEPRYLSIVKTADLIILTMKAETDKKLLEDMMKKNFINVKSIFVNAFHENPSDIKKRIWSSLGMIIVYSKRRGISPMALPKGSTVSDFAERIHKDFVKNFRYATLWRNNRKTKIGLDYRLKAGDIVEIHLK